MAADCPPLTGVKIGTGPNEIRECKVSESGSVGRVDGESLTYELLCLMPNPMEVNSPASKCDDGSFEAGYQSHRAMILFTSSKNSKKPRPLFEKIDAELGTRSYEKPKIVIIDRKKVLVLPIHVDGTGAGNESEYYLREKGQWVLIESESWQKEVRKKIPKDLQIWKGIWPDLETMTAETGLYKTGDANCCPTGGRAVIKLKLLDKKLILSDVTILPTEKEN